MRRPRLGSAHVLPSACAALLAIAVMLPAEQAAGATLQLAGPAGATVRVNGAVAGFLPLAEPLTVAPGSYEITCELPGRQPFRKVVRFLQDDEWRHVTIDLLPYSRRTAVFSNLVLAGLGPHYLGKPVRGWLYSAAEIGGLVAAVYGETARSSAHDEYLLAMDAYAGAINADDIIALRAAADAKYRDVSDAADLRDLGVAVAVGAIAVSMLDSWLSFASVTSGAGDLPTATAAAAQTGPDAAPAFHTAVRLSF
ncbi:MAG: hypothetical protein IPK64_16290 [bacterium]|nr:hypothetical protein [bacterium]